MEARNYIDRRWTALILLCVAQFVVVLDASIVNVALPSIGTALDFSEQDLPWVVNAYVIAFGGFLLLGGRAADLLGRRRVFLVGLVGFAAASLVGGLSTSQEMLIGARAVQGLGGAIVDEVRALAAHPGAVEAERADDAPQLRVQMAVVERHRLAGAFGEDLADVGGRRHGRPTLSLVRKRWILALTCLAH